jgi:plastocyanin
MKPVRIASVLIIAVALLLVAGCGGDDDGNSDTTNTTSTAPAAGGNGEAGGTTTVSMDEYAFDPDSLSVKKGDTITVKNDGNIGHNLTIEQGPDPKKKSKKLAGTSTFLGGKSEDLTVDLNPGKYAMACTVSGHRELGMTGTVTVK